MWFTYHAFHDKAWWLKLWSNTFLKKINKVLSAIFFFLIWHEDEAASRHLFLFNRSLFARRLSIDSRASVISQHARWPIRTPRPICANQDAWVVITPKRPKANSMHTATWHAWTRTPLLNIVKKAVFSLKHFLVSFIRLWPSCNFYLRGDSR